MADGFEGAINPASLNLSAASAAAIADLSAPAAPATPDIPGAEPVEPVAPVAAPPEEAAQATPPAEDAEETPTPEEEATPEESPTEEEPVEVQKKWTLKAGGKVHELSEEEVVRRAQMGIDYEQKTQALSQERRHLLEQQQLIQRQQQELLEVVQDPRRLEALRQHVTQQLGLPEDPNEVITAQQAADMMRRQMQAMQLHMQQQQQALMWEQEVASYEKDYVQDVSKTVQAAIVKHPVLRAVDDLETVLKLDVAKQLQANPTDDITEVTRLLSVAAARRAAKIEAEIETHKKMEAVRAAKAARPAARLEPPTGQGVRPAPTPQNLRLGSRELTDQVTRELQEAFSKAR